MFVLDSHDSHNSTYANDVLSMNTNTSSKTVMNTKNSKSLSLNDKIDLSLAKYKVSLEKVVATINCKDAKAFAQRIFDECENQLLKPNLTEGSKYYNLRTKEITQNALNKIGDCPKEK
jgi:hypothetical protein